MEITSLGLSSLLINSRDKILLSNPNDLVNQNRASAIKKSDILTFSNSEHSEYLNTSFREDIKLVQGPGEYEIANYYITGIPTAVKENGLPSGAVNTVYLIRSEGLVLCHLGLLSQHLTPTQLELLRQTQILIAPIAPGRTLSFGEIQEIISAIQPRILIPLEYNAEKTSETHLKFLSEVGASDAQPVNRFNVTETNLPADLQTVILNEQS